MKKWYEFYSTKEALEILHQLGGELQSFDSQAETTIQQIVGEEDFPAVLGLVPWGHHIQIIAKCKTIEEALL